MSRTHTVYSIHIYSIHIYTIHLYSIQYLAAKLATPSSPEDAMILTPTAQIDDIVGRVFPLHKMIISYVR